MEDVQARVLASVVDASKTSNKQATCKDDSAGHTPLDGECCRGEKFTLYVEVEKNWGLQPRAPTRGQKKL